jgi:hypothetical protein
VEIRWALMVPAVLLILVGGTFALQGAAVLPSAVMHGKVEWLVIGLVMVVVGLVLAYRAVGSERGGP